MDSSRVTEILERRAERLKSQKPDTQRERDVLRPVCGTCHGSGGVRKPIEEWDDGDHEYNACPRINPPVKICPTCGGTGRV